MKTKKVLSTTSLESKSQKGTPSMPKIVTSNEKSRCKSLFDIIYLNDPCMLRSLKRKMKTSNWTSRPIAGLALVALFALLPIPVLQAQIFLDYNNGIGEYTITGTTVNAALVSDQGLAGPDGILVMGSDIFVVNDAGGASGGGSIGEYTTTGSVVNSSLITGLTNPLGLALSGSDLFVTEGTPGKVGEFTITGTTVNASFITGLTSPNGIVLSGTNLFIASAGSSANTGKISEFTTTGTKVNASLVTGLEFPYGVAVSGSNLFVTIPNTGSVSEFTTTGTLVNSALITDISLPTNLAVSGSDLFVIDAVNEQIGEYTTTGTIVNASLISGISQGPADFFVEVAPEPSVWVMLLGGLAGLVFYRGCCGRNT